MNLNLDDMEDKMERGLEYLGLGCFRVTAARNLMDPSAALSLHLDLEIPVDEMVRMNADPGHIADYVVGKLTKGIKESKFYDAVIERERRSREGF